MPRQCYLASKVKTKGALDYSATWTRLGGRAMSSTGVAATRAAKQLLRKEIKQRIVALGESEIQRQSQEVIKLLLCTEKFKSSQRISVFLSMKDEIRTESLLEQMFALNKLCFIPRYTKTSMDMVRLQSMQDYHSLPETAWKIKQPALDDSREDAMETGGLDMILMPGMAFSRTGDRLGRGKGYYDTYLEKYSAAFGKRPYLLALTFNESVCDTIPVTEHDIPVDEVLYENKLKT